MPYQRDDDHVSFALDQHALLEFYNAISMKQNSAGRYVAPLGTNYLDSESTSLCSYFFMLRAERRSTTYQFDSIWFEPNGA